MNAHKCDRCGKYYDKNKRFSAEYDNGPYVVGVRARCKNSNGTYSNDIAYDLCDDCIMEFYKWLHRIVEE